MSALACLIFKIPSVMVIDDGLIHYLAEEGWLDESADVASLDHSTLCSHKTHFPIRVHILSILAVSSYIDFFAFCDVRSCRVNSSRDLFLFSRESCRLESDGPGHYSIYANARRFAHEAQSILWVASKCDRIRT
jgi:hypothetical protein